MANKYGLICYHGEVSGPPVHLPYKPPSTALARQLQLGEYEKVGLIIVTRASTSWSVLCTIIERRQPCGPAAAAIGLFIISADPSRVGDI